MKKTLFAILAVLFTIALIATCDVFEPVLDVVEEVPQFTPDGRPMVRVTIDLGGGVTSRSLISGSASTVSDTYEVVFLDLVNTSTTYRTIVNNVASTGTTTTLYIPVGDYDGADKAVAFAGTNQTLLGVGSITLGANVTTAQTVTFILHPLVSDAGSSGSSFSAGTTIPDEQIPGFSSFTAFAVGRASSIPGKYTVRTNASTLQNNGGILIKGTWGGSQITTLPTNLGITTKYESLAGSVTVTGVSSGTVSSDGVLDFNLNTTGVSEEGYTMVNISVPVVAIREAATAGTWFIRGGLNNSNFDESDEGGAVMLKVGTPVTKREFYWVDIDVGF